MKKQTLLLIALLATAVIFTIASCEKDKVPDVKTHWIEEITATTVLAGGDISDPGTSPVTSRGVCWSSASNRPTLSDDYQQHDGTADSFKVLVEGLSAQTSYYLRAYASNEAGTGYGEAVYFVTTKGVETLEVEEITHHSALGGGVIHDHGLGPVLSKGICWSTDSLFSNGNNRYLASQDESDDFAVLMEDLDPGTDYYVRAYAVNQIDSAFGNTVFFATQYEKVTDIEGNQYRIHTIGNQTWMIDNLRTTRFSNGDPIPLREENQYWTAETALDEPAYCWYQNDESYADPYGALYNFEAAADPRNVCPTGWRVMTDDDHKELIMGYLGGSAGGGKLKTTGTIEQETGLWYAPNTAATNDSGFSAIPAGLRHPVTGAMGYHSVMWTSTSVNNSAIALGLANHEKWARVYHYEQHYGFSIRCVKE